ncbi:MAG: hypothetical protein ABL908_13335 [Hyphomicrobium sp.]
MKTTFSSLVLASAVALSAIAGGAVAETGATGAGASMADLKPRQGVSLDVGHKRAVGYFLTDSRICNLTLLVTDRMAETGSDIPAATRLQFDVAAGSDVRVDTSEGKALAFACATDAKSMSVTRLDQMAAYAPRR